MSGEDSAWEFNEEATRELMESPGVAARPLSGDAEAVLAWVLERYAATGQGMPLARIAEAMGFGSRRRLYEALSELEAARKVRTRQLQERGRPRLVELVSAYASAETLDGTGTKSGGPR